MAIVTSLEIICIYCSAEKPVLIGTTVVSSDPESLEHLKVKMHSQIRQALSNKGFSSSDWGFLPFSLISKALLVPPRSSELTFDSLPVLAALGVLGEQPCLQQSTQLEVNG